MSIVRNNIHAVRRRGGGAKVEADQPNKPSCWNTVLVSDGRRVESTQSCVEPPCLWCESGLIPLVLPAANVFIFPSRRPFINLWHELAPCLKRLVLNWLIPDQRCGGGGGGGGVGAQFLTGSLRVPMRTGHLHPSRQWACLTQRTSHSVAPRPALPLSPSIGRMMMGCLLHV